MFSTQFKNSFWHLFIKKKKKPKIIHMNQVLCIICSRDNEAKEV